MNQIFALDLNSLALICAGMIAAIFNTLAGGGPLITIGAMIFLGIDPKIANVTSTLALSPGQILSALSMRDENGELPSVPIDNWHIICLLGGALGALSIIAIPSDYFTAQIPWLILFATSIYIAKAFSAKFELAPKTTKSKIRNYSNEFILFLLSVYGGYFGGGNSFLVLALLSANNLSPKMAGRSKNLIIAAINLAAAILIIVTSAFSLKAAILIGIGALFGGAIGAKLLLRIPDKAVFFMVSGIGIALSAWMLLSK